MASAVRIGASDAGPLAASLDGSHELSATLLREPAFQPPPPQACYIAWEILDRTYYYSGSTQGPSHALGTALAGVRQSDAD